VKNNTEYSAVLAEIETIKQEKAQGEEEILGLMELQERLAGEIREGEGRYRGEEQRAQQDEVVVKKKLEAVETELAGVRAERDSRARELPRPLLTDYEKILKARAGVAGLKVPCSSICCGCLVSIRPQATEELKTANALMVSESSVLYLY